MSVETDERAVATPLDVPSDGALRHQGKGIHVQKVKRGRAAALRAPLRKVLLAAGLCSASSLAGAFEATLAEPAFTLSVPALPAMQLTERSDSSAAATRQFAGGDATYAAALSVERAGRSVTTRECAGSLLRALIARPGMPARDSVYRAPLNERTFLVIYILEGPAGPVLHAHLLASAASTHCIDAHFSRAQRAGEDEDDWRKFFLDAKVVDRPR